MNARPHVGFAGLGLMGSRMAANVMRAGYGLSVWNRTPAKADGLVQAGARLAATPKELAASCDVVITMLADPAALSAVCYGESGLIAGARGGFRLIDMSTVGPAESRKLAAALAARGADLLEAPVTGSKVGAEQATLLIMASGKREVHDELLPLLSTMGSKVLYVGGTGAASQLKLIGNLIITHMLEGFCEGLVLGAKAGLPAQTILDLVMSSGFASPYFTFKGKAIMEHDFDTHFSVDLMHKDLVLALLSANELGVPLPAAAAIREIYQAARAAGDGQADIAATVKVLEKLANTRVK